jgi:hypothetical protein
MPFAFVQYFFQAERTEGSPGLRPTWPNRVKANEHFSTKLVDGVFF